MTPSQFDIRPATVDDTVAIRRMHAESWLATYPSEEHGVPLSWVQAHTDSWLTPEALEESAGYVERAINDKSGYYRLAEQNDQIVGFVHATTSSDGSKELEAIYIHPATFGKGLGGELMRLAIDWIGDNPASLQVATYNQRAIGFYEKYGFRIVDGTEDIYRDKLPMITMRREVSRG